MCFGNNQEVGGTRSQSPPNVDMEEISSMNTQKKKTPAKPTRNGIPLNSSIENGNILK